MASTSGKLISLKLKAGFHRESTQYAEEGRWFDGDRVRFRKGRPENLRGYSKNHDTPIEGIGRDLLTWQNNDTEKLLSVGTEKKLYILSNGINYDVTPIRTTVSIDSAVNGSFSTSVGSPLIEVSLNAHGVSVGDFIAFSSTSINGFTTDGLDFSVTAFGGPVFEAVSVAGTTIFYVSTLSVAASTETDHGHGTAQFLIATGQNAAIQGLGFGAGIFRAGTSTTGLRAWNEAASSSDITFQSTQWTLDNFGEDMLAVRRGSQLFHWDADASLAPVRCSVVGTGPSKINAVVVSQNDRHVMALGTNTAGTSVFDPLLVRWSDQENYANWAPSISSTAGEIAVIEGSQIIGGKRGRNATHIWTDKALYAFQFVGPPFIFKTNLLGTNCGLLGPHAAIDVDGNPFWMGNENFFVFDGRVKKIDCTVRSYVFDAFNKVQADKVYAGINSEFREIIWLYPKDGAIEPNAYVIYNYEENHWVYGTSFYSTFADSDTYSNTLATGAVSVSADTYIWDNEPSGIYNGDGEALTSYLQSADLDLGDGDELMFMDKIIPDFDINQSNICITVKTKSYPNGPETTKGPYMIGPATEKVNFRARGRTANINVSSSNMDVDWRMGNTRMAVQTDGKR